MKFAYIDRPLEPLIGAKRPPNTLDFLQRRCARWPARDAYPRSRFPWAGAASISIASGFPSGSLLGLAQARTSSHPRRIRRRSCIACWLAVELYLALCAKLQVSEETMKRPRKRVEQVGYVEGPKDGSYFLRYWSEPDAGGKRSRRAVEVGTKNQFGDRTQANLSVEAAVLRRQINAGVLEQDHGSNHSHFERDKMPLAATRACWYRPT